jgi:hypothetical protein
LQRATCNVQRAAGGEVTKQVANCRTAVKKGVSVFHTGQHCETNAPFPLFQFFHKKTRKKQSRRAFHEKLKPPKLEEAMDGGRVGALVKRTSTLHPPRAALTTDEWGRGATRASSLSLCQPPKTLVACRVSAQNHRGYLYRYCIAIANGSIARIGNARSSTSLVAPQRHQETPRPPVKACICFGCLTRTGSASTTSSDAPCSSASAKCDGRHRLCHPEQQPTVA